MKLFFQFFPLEIHCWGVPEAKNTVQPNSYIKWRGAEHFEISLIRLMEFHQSYTWKISQIDEIPLAWYLKNHPDWWNSIDLVPEKLVIRLNPMDGLARVPRGVELSEAHMRKVEKLSYNSIGLAQSNQQMRT